MQTAYNYYHELLLSTNFNANKEFEFKPACVIGLQLIHL